VANGQPSTFTVDAWPDRQYTATVQRVAFGSAVTDNVVTYLAELVVINDDLSLRPGMTATADIRVADSSNVFVVPAAALRFNPVAVAGTTGTAKKSFVQSLIPMPTRNKSRPTEPDDGVGATGAHIWVLRAGVPELLPITTGLSDGHHTEISGAGLSEGLIVILRVAAPPT
jgi:HlyD family secretion protein